MADALTMARDVLRMVAIGIQQTHITARDVEFLYDDGPKRVSVHRLAVEAMRGLEAEIAARGVMVDAPAPAQKPTVTHLMRLAVAMRHAPSDGYDAAYKCLQNALYAALGVGAPAPREPLTENEVISLMDSNGIPADPETLFAIVELVERAHGIGVSEAGDLSWDQREKTLAAGVMVDVAPGYCNPVTGEPYLQSTDPLQRVLAGLDYFLIVKEERRFIEGARAELALHLAAAGVALPDGAQP